VTDTKIETTFETEGEFIVFIAENAPTDIFTRAEDVEEFQKHLYGDSVRDKQTVLEHWAYNATVNNVDDASRLDGWGDLERGMVTFHVVGGSTSVVVYREGPR
jgi:hypothetical protein